MFFGLSVKLHAVSFLRESTIYEGVLGLLQEINYKAERVGNIPRQKLRISEIKVIHLQEKSQIFFCDYKVINL